MPDPTRPPHASGPGRDPGLVALTAILQWRSAIAGPEMIFFCPERLRSFYTSINFEGWLPGPMAACFPEPQDFQNAAFRGEEGPQSDASPVFY